MARLWPTAAAVLVMLLACVAYFAPQLSNKVILSGDTVQAEGMHQEIVAFNEATGERDALDQLDVRWHARLPTLRAGDGCNLLRYVEDVLHLGFERPIGYFFAIMLGLFVLLRVLGGGGVGVDDRRGGLRARLQPHDPLRGRAHDQAADHQLYGTYPRRAHRSVQGPLLGRSGVCLPWRWGSTSTPTTPQMTYYLAAACGVFVVFRLIRDLQLGLLKRWGGGPGD